MPTSSAFAPFPPMRPIDLPARYSDRLSPAEWIGQPKYDGWHVVFWQGRALTRQGEDITDWAFFRDHCAKGFTLPDCGQGELWSSAGRNAVAALRHDATGGQCTLFDMPSGEPLEHRLSALVGLARESGFHAAPMFANRQYTWKDWQALARTMIQIGHEGIVLKRKGSLWSEGESADWRRMKARDL